MLASRFSGAPNDMLHQLHKIFWGWNYRKQGLRHTKVQQIGTWAIALGLFISAFRDFELQLFGPFKSEKPSEAH
jgi:hypothetical protein